MARGYPDRRRFVQSSPYSTRAHAADALGSLFRLCRHVLPDHVATYFRQVRFEGRADTIYFPSPFKSHEAVTAIKALEACMASAIADLREDPCERAISVDLDRVACFLMSAYIVTIDGMKKADPKVKTKIPDTDLHQAHSVLYRRMSAGLHRGSCGGYYHIHGSLEATPTMAILGMDPFRTDLSDYEKIAAAYARAVGRFTVQELDALNVAGRQAGAPSLRWEEFRDSPHGQAVGTLPPFTVEALESETPPIPFAEPWRTHEAPPQCLQGIRVLELCRIIAGPTIGRSLAAHGASVLKITSGRLPDIPFFQIDVNTGKHCAQLDLRDARDRAVFDDLLEQADVLIDGYRPGALARLGYGPEQLRGRALARGRGYVYVAEDCFGGTGVGGAEWADRAGWQQIADCITGLAWDQGEFMGHEYPVVPPFPMSDYGTGALGSLAVLTALYRRATQGGSWACRTSLVQYDLFLRSLGTYPPEVCRHLRSTHSQEFFALRHFDTVDVVGQRALESMRPLHPHLFGEGGEEGGGGESAGATTNGKSTANGGGGGGGGGGGNADREESGLMQKAWSRAYGAEIKWPREAVRIKGMRVGHVRATRPNGTDEPSWEGWEEDIEVVSG